MALEDLVQFQEAVPKYLLTKIRFLIIISLLARRNRVLNFPVLMLVVLLNTDGTISKGIVPFESYDSCYKSLKHTVDSARYVWSDRVCVSAKLYDRLGSPKNKG